MKYLVSFAVIFFTFLSFSNTSVLNVLGETKQISYMDAPSPWADSVFAQMSLDEKIGQLFNVAAYSNKDATHQKELEELIQKYHVGGLTFFKGGPMRQAKLTNHYQKLSKLPLMIAIDGEWGLSMRLDSTVRYPWQMTLGAIQDDSLIYQMGFDIARQFRRLGVHVNFAPVVDVNNNPDNPVIFARSFGEDKRNVARKGVAYMKGMQDGRILACAKHFPGHGDTDADSHVTLPVVNHNMERIDSIELFPFKSLIAEGVASVMSAHLYLPQITPNEKVASSLSPKVVDTLLKQRLGFKGLVFTDGLNMGGVSNYQKSEDIDLQAILAGNDVLLLSQNVPEAVKRIKAVLEEDSSLLINIEESVLKILKAKEWLGLQYQQAIKLDHLVEDLNRSKYEYLNRTLVENSLSLLRNKKKLLPIKNLKNERIISVAFTEKGVCYQPFQRSLNLYAKVDTLVYKDLSVTKQKLLMDTLLNYDKIIISIHKSNKSPWVKAELNNEFKNFINILRLRKEVILTVFANAYSLKDFLAAEHVNALLMAYQNSVLAQELSAQLIFGAVKAKGRLPIGISKALPLGIGEDLSRTIRLKYTMPEEVGIESVSLASIDSIVKEGMEAKAFPGAQVYVAKSGNVIYHKAFGKHVYDEEGEVRKTDLYDLASVTKIASTLLAIMELDGDGKLSLDDRLGKHLKMTRGTPYEDLVLRNILAHQAGLAAWIPFYNKTLHKGQPRYDIYSTAKSDKYPVEVAKDFYMIEEYRDTIFYRILHRAKVNPKKEYKYSDIGYYFLKKVVEKHRKEEIDIYNEDSFYASLGMNYTLFKPLNKFPLEVIVPTEYDKVFRKQQIHGYVHDPGAAMLGGIGGHAGLFSNANDVGKLMQMYLQNGQYGGKEYLKREVLEEYTKCQFCNDSIPIDPKENRRGAGFDKPQVHGEPGPTCECISFNSFGHSGFTGTYAWVDPDEDLVYVFLSNRIYPSAKNKKLLELDIRTRIQEQIYNAIHRKEDETSSLK